MPRLLGFLLLLISVNTFTQDLVGHLYEGPLTFDQYEEMSVKFTIKNTGIVPVSRSGDTYLYLSEDTTIDPDDKRIGHSYSADVAANGGTYVQKFDRMTCTAIPGNYYLLFDIDAGHGIQETDDDNNVFVVADIVVNPSSMDWYVSYFSIDSPDYVPEPYPGYDPWDTIFHHYERVMPGLVMQNGGSTNTGISIALNFYISRDSIFDNHDILYGTGYVSTYGSDDGIQSMGFHSLDYLFLFPDSLQPGSYYIVGQIDPSNIFYETDETNNIFVSESIVVGRSNLDLQITNIPFVGSMQFDRIPINYEVTNNGNSGAGNFSIHVYISEDSIFSENDPYLEPFLPSFDQLYIEARGTLVSGEEYSHEYAYPIPPPGDYYVIVVVNQGNELRETNYLNNTYISSTPILNIPLPPVPVVTLTEATFTGTYDNTDTSFPLTVTLNNSGDPLTELASLDFLIRDENGNIIALKSAGVVVNLYKDETAQYNLAINLNTPLAYGTYSVEITSDEEWYYTDSFITTLVIDDPTFTISGIIQGEDEVPINHGKIFLYQKHDDGKVSFINKTLFTNANNFSFETDHHQHTLFYIPNPVTYPQYAPTILGKTVVLKDFCFFNLTQDTDTVFEILRVTPLPLGTKTVSGNIQVEAPHAGRMERPSGAQRIAQLGEEIEGFPVVLLSDTGDPVKVTMADSNGYYEFTGLPDDEYELVVALELDQPVMQEPISVDVRTSDAIIDFGIGQEVTTPEVFYKQQITFNTFSVKKFGDAPFIPDLSVSSNLAVTLTSSDPTVAIIKDGKIEIVGAGRAIITALQEGEGQFLPATPVERELVVGRAIQTINISDLPVKTFGDNEFDLSATSSSGLPVVYTSSNKNVATVTNGKATIVGAGTTTIKAIQNGDKNYLPAEVVEKTLVVNKVNESLMVNDIPEKTFGNPSFKLSIETTSTRPVLIASSNNSIARYSNGKIYIYGAGTVDIEVRIDANNNYSGASVTKQLVIKKANQGIDFKELPEVDIEQQTLVLEARSSAFLPVSFQSDNEAIATVSGNEVHFHTAGVVNIIATQGGSQNYTAATPVSRELKINVVSSVESNYNAGVTAYPNPVIDYLNVKSAQPIESFIVTDILGREVKAFTWKDSQLDLSHLASGVYYLKVTTVKSQNILRLNKQ